MDFEVVLSNRAQMRLSNAVAYISEVLCSPVAANRLLVSVELATETLKVNPTFSVINHRASKNLKRTVYQKPIGNYKLLFYVDSDKHTVVVFSFLHMKQNERSLLRFDYLES